MSPEKTRLRTRTNIVATVGPACATLEKLTELAIAGVDVFRINMAHGGRAFHDQVVDLITQIRTNLDRPLGILVDLSGPKIRLGELQSSPMACHEGDTVRFVRGEVAHQPDELVCTYEKLIDELAINDRVMLADGVVSLTVTGKEPDAVICRVVSGGEVRNRQGVNLPGAQLSTPALTDEDIDNAKWAALRKADFVGLSFVRSPEEVKVLQELLRKNNSRALVIAKIEKPEAVANLDAIIATSDGAMVARGDLGVEIDVAETPVVQKRIIATCNRMQKPVIVATQMLDSMHHSKHPTRAEVSDVANAILDGADACMLSGETAVGEYPRETVEMMERIICSAEQLLKNAPKPPPPDWEAAKVHPITAAVVYGAAAIAEQVNAKLVVIATRGGKTALVKSKQRTMIPAIGVSSSEETLRQMCLFWGITPLPGAPVEDGPMLRKFIENWGKSLGYFLPGDRVVFVTGAGFYSKAHNLVVVHEVE